MSLSVPLIKSIENVLVKSLSFGKRIIYAFSISMKAGILRSTGPIVFWNFWGKNWISIGKRPNLNFNFFFELILAGSAKKCAAIFLIVVFFLTKNMTNRQSCSVIVEFVDKDRMYSFSWRKNCSRKKCASNVIIQVFVSKNICFQIAMIFIFIKMCFRLRVKNVGNRSQFTNFPN